MVIMWVNTHEILAQHFRARLPRMACTSVSSNANRWPRYLNTSTCSSVSPNPLGMPWLRRRLVYFFSANTDVLHRSLLLGVIFMFIKIGWVEQVGACQVSSVGRAHDCYSCGHGFNPWLVVQYWLLSRVCVCNLTAGSGADSLPHKTGVLYWLVSCVCV